jgi:hypothetical protein
MTITDNGIREDIRVDVCGGLYLVTAVSQEAREWLTDRVYEDAIWWGCSLVVEGAYFPDLFDALCDEGYIVR